MRKWKQQKTRKINRIGGHLKGELEDHDSSLELTNKVHHQRMQLIGKPHPLVRSDLSRSD